MEMNVNAIDIEELIKDDEEMKSAVATLQKAMQNTTEYSPSYCRRLAFALLVGIIPDKHACDVFRYATPTYHGVCSFIISTMTCDGMTEAEAYHAKRQREDCGPYMTTIQALW
jgi:hypothetical protein